MSHVAQHIGLADVSQEFLSGARLAEATGRADLDRLRTRGGLVGRALEIGAQERQQRIGEFEAGAERFGRATEREQEVRTELREFRREEFDKDFQVAQKRQQAAHQINVDAISDFMEDAKKASVKQIISDVGALGLSTIFVGLAPSLGLTISEAIGIGVSLGSTIGGVPASGGVQAVAQIGGGLTGLSRAEDERESLRRRAEENAERTRFALSDDPREGFVPNIGEQFRP